jgi:RNA polymerase sigma-70 factor (ECF subfamily)
MDDSSARSHTDMIVAAGGSASARSSRGASSQQEETPNLRNCQDESRVLLEIAGGGHDALATLFYGKAQMVRAAIKRILRDDAESEDTLQDVFLEIWTKATKYDPKRGEVAAWIMSLAYSRALDRRRHLDARQFYSSERIDDSFVQIADTGKGLMSNGNLLEEVLGKEKLARFQEELSAEQFQTLQLFFFEGHALKEIAELTGRSLVNVRSHYYRGLERIRKIVFGPKGMPK